MHRVNDARTNLEVQGSNEMDSLMLRKVNIMGSSIMSFMIAMEDSPACDLALLCYYVVLTAPCICPEQRGSVSFLSHEIVMLCGSVY